MFDFNCRALDQALKILKENQISSPMTTSFGAREDLVLLDDTPVREMMVKVMCHGIVSKFKMKQVIELSLVFIKF